MTSADHPDHADRTGDAGLLSPGRAGSAAEAATGDASFLRAMLDAEAALARAQAAVGLTPTAAAEVITSTAGRSCSTYGTWRCGRAPGATR